MTIEYFFKSTETMVYCILCGDKKVFYYLGFQNLSKARFALQTAQ